MLKSQGVGRHSAVSLICWAFCARSVNLPAVLNRSTNIPILLIVTPWKCVITCPAWHKITPDFMTGTIFHLKNWSAFRASCRNGWKSIGFLYFDTVQNSGSATHALCCVNNLEKYSLLREWNCKVLLVWAGESLNIDTICIYPQFDTFVCLFRIVVQPWPMKRIHTRPLPLRLAHSGLYFFRTQHVVSFPPLWPEHLALTLIHSPFNIQLLPWRSTCITASFELWVQRR